MTNWLSTNPFQGRNPRITIAYERFSEEDIEAGDTDDRGWLEKEGIEVEPDEDETLAEATVQLLRDSGATEPSSSFFHKDIWYNYYGEADFRTGELENLSYFLEDFTVDEQREVYEGLQRPRRRR